MSEPCCYAKDRQLPFHSPDCETCECGHAVAEHSRAGCKHGCRATCDLDLAQLEDSGAGKDGR